MYNKVGRMLQGLLCYLHPETNRNDEIPPPDGARHAVQVLKPEFAEANRNTERTTGPQQPIRWLNAHDVAFVSGRRGKLDVEAMLTVAM